MVLLQTPTGWRFVVKRGSPVFEAPKVNSQKNGAFKTPLCWVCPPKRLFFVKTVSYERSTPVAGYSRPVGLGPPYEFVEKIF